MTTKPYGAYAHLGDAYKTILRLIGQGYHKNELILLCPPSQACPQGDKAHVQRALLENVCQVICQKDDQVRFFQELTRSSEIRFARERLKNGAFVLFIAQDNTCAL